MTAGYSGTPLARKLGIGEGARVCVLGDAVDYPALLGAVPSAVSLDVDEPADADLIHCFVPERALLEALLVELRPVVSDGRPVWVSWPKKASRVPTTVTEDVIREVALPLGLVDVKVCAVSSVWSGLKLVVRKALRA